MLVATGPVAFRVDTDIIGLDPRDRQEGRGAQQGLSMSCSYRLLCVMRSGCMWGSLSA